MPFDCEAGLPQYVAQSLRSDIRQELVLRSMALKDRQPFAFLEQRGPFLCTKERSGQLDQSGIGLRRSEHHVARQHCALGKPSENSLAWICPELLFDFFQKCQHLLSRRSETFGNVLREISYPTSRLIRCQTRHVDEPPGARIA